MASVWSIATLPPLAEKSANLFVCVFDTLYCVAPALALLQVMFAPAIMPKVLPARLKFFAPSVIIKVELPTFVGSMFTG